MAMEIAASVTLKLAEYAVAPVARQLRGPRVSEMMKTLEEEIRQGRIQLEDAEKRQVNEEEVKNWLGDVKHVYYDMIDLLDELSIVETESQIRHLRPKLYFLGPLGKFLYYRNFEGKMKNLINEMQRFSRAGKRDWKLEGGGDEGDSQLERPVFSSKVVGAKTYGRDDEAEILRSKLISPRKGIHYLTLVGISGIGKTTLAQTVYDDPGVQDHFKPKVWINVSDEFNLYNIARIIIQSVPETASLNIPIDEVDSEVLLQRVSQIIKDKKFLFVLDDVRNEDAASIQRLRAICKDGAPGSMILITTRKDIAAHTAGGKAQQIMRLGRISDQDCWHIIRYYALDSDTDESKRVRPFIKVGREIANKCDGLPVLAKSLAGILRSRGTVQEWLEVLQIDMWETSSNLPVGVQPSLMLSYFFLPNSALRQCLLYCSIFPKDHVIDVHKLFKLWIAQGYFDSHYDKMEEKAEECFQELSNRSFFHELKKDGKGNSTCKLVGAISDFLQFLAEKECDKFLAENEHRILPDDKTKYSPNKAARHWTLKVASQVSLPGALSNFIQFLTEKEPVDDKTENNSSTKPRHKTGKFESQAYLSDSIGKQSKLYTLVVLAEYSYTDPKKLSSLLSHFRTLRALDLSYCSVREPPIKAGSLLHLRYLDLSFNRDLKKLPKVICHLPFLQTLNLNGCDSLRKLPKAIGKLSRLRHLEILWTKSLSYLPKGISSLTSLRTLNRFMGNAVHRKACNFRDLKDLKHLRGCISIDGLGGATDVAQAREARLKEKEEIRGLELWFFGVGYEGIKDAYVLRALEPPPALKYLGIHYYKATSFPRWITTLQHLKELMLSDCSQCDTLPALGKLEFLQTLELRNMTKLQKVGAEFLGIQLSDGGEETNLELSVFPKLENLRFRKLTNWELWEELPKMGEALSIMPQLSSMSTTGCTKINALPNFIKNKKKGNLKTIIVEDCPLIASEDTRQEGSKKGDQSKHLATNAGAALPNSMEGEAK
ncbi:hypothetical protein L6164_003705 [Bauhinia variegata]|uniref:Uncharacterized protein n=1 Tax=Bauhinia variegata TaxID=167791 RepID=A0ACB9Q241_BAUVA|nr:hypothetical protein L6164_003705 [Bauhinia variegata]